MKKLIWNALAVFGGFSLAGILIKNGEDYQKKHEGTTRISGGVWKDDYDNIYDKDGKKLGRVIWERDNNEGV